MSLSKTLMLAASGLLATTLAANAAATFETLSYGFAATNWGTSSNTLSYNPLQPLAFNGFNTGLGTLTSVVVYFTESSHGMVNMINNGNDASNVDSYLLNNGKMRIPIIGTKTVTDVSTDYSEYLAAGASSGAQTVTGSATSATYTITGAANLASFTVPWSALVGDLGGVQVSADNGNGSATYTDYGQVAVFVQYNYDLPVPEPGTIGMLSAGLLGLGSFLRRRKR